ncbi:MAG: hypothetical protein IKG42_00745 [Clostridia bacterium]|nr:hypothetical protein [Clostridia bacterium]
MKLWAKVIIPEDTGIDEFKLIEALKGNPGLKLDLVISDTNSESCLIINDLVVERAMPIIDFDYSAENAESGESEGKVIELVSEPEVEEAETEAEVSESEEEAVVEAPESEDEESEVDDEAEMELKELMQSLRLKPGIVEVEEEAELEDEEPEDEEEAESELEDEEPEDEEEAESELEDEESEDEEEAESELEDEESEDEEEAESELEDEESKDEEETESEEVQKEVEVEAVPEPEEEVTPMSESVERLFAKPDIADAVSKIAKLRDHSIEEKVSLVADILYRANNCGLKRSVYDQIVNTSVKRKVKEWEFLDEIITAADVKMPDVQKFEKILTLYVYGSSKKKGLFAFGKKNEAVSDQKVDALEFLRELQRVCLDGIEMKSIYGV